MLLSLRSTEGIVPQYDGTSSFLLFDDESEGEEEEELMDKDEEEEDDSEISGYSVENAFFDEKEDACAALGEISVNSSVAFLPYMESVFEEVFKLLEVRGPGGRSGWAARGPALAGNTTGPSRPSSSRSALT